MKESVKEMEIGDYVDDNRKSQTSEQHKKGCETFKKLFKGRKKKVKESESDEPL